MPMNPSGAYGMYAHDAQLEQVMLTLNQSGFDKQDICMMVSPSHPLAKIVRQGQVLSAEREGGVAAGVMRWLFEFGAVMIPTVGFFIRSQAFLRALVTGKDSASLCGKSRPLVGLGFSEYDADRFESQLRDVGVLVYVACPEKANATWALEVLRKTGAHEPALLGQNAAMTAAA
ncbi:MAG: hypothetical protein WAN65_19670 [Candidatus Sulfotelmatobacter sp.]